MRPDPGGSGSGVIARSGDSELRRPPCAGATKLLAPRIGGASAISRFRFWRVEQLHEATLPLRRADQEQLAIGREPGRPRRAHEDLSFWLERDDAAVRPLAAPGTR